MEDFALLSLEAIRQYLRQATRPLAEEVLRTMERDSRRGVRELARRERRQAAADQLELNRLERLLPFERELWAEGIEHVAGVDEAGVGPLAGPVVAAAVIFKPGTLIRGIDDSKKLSAARREATAGEILQNAISTGIGIASPEEIDNLNIYVAGLLAMRRAVESLSPPADHLLIDARKIPEVSLPQTPLIKGDQRSYSIAAASILAKTKRDEIMRGLDLEYPGYGFAQHKGYPTASHQAAIRRLGLSPHHRKTFSVAGLETSQPPPQVPTDRLRRAISKARSFQELARLEERALATSKSLAYEEHKELLQLLLQKKKELGTLF